MKIALVVGTRPEAIKMVPLYLAMKTDKRIEATMIATAQHREMLDQVLSVFSTQPDIDLDIMQPNQTLADITASVITRVQRTFSEIKPDVVLVHGDTTTCLASALAAFYEHIPVGHVEAGLRTYDFQAPWPEEMNRRLVDPICRWCFAPTKNAANNLRCEQIPERNIFITGNTVIDALLLARRMTQESEPPIPGLPPDVIDNKRFILVTGHRRESFGKPFEEFCLALRDIVHTHKDVCVIYPVHLNPNVQRPVQSILGGEKSIYLIEPLEYLPFVHLMNRCHLIITDSGGIQEEAPSFGKPVLVTRAVTERPEAIQAGLAKLLGTDRKTIVREASRLLTEPSTYAAMSTGENPYGDGTASQAIVAILCESMKGTAGADV